MKNYTVLAIIILLNTNLFAQVYIQKNENDLYQVNDNYIKTYSILPTVHWGYLIKLNTRTGQMWQIEFNHKKTKQLEIPLSNLSLIEKQNEVDNRFKLLPADSSNFLLLDQINGKIWQVTWDIRFEKNKIAAINDSALIDEQNIIENRFSLNPTLDSSYFLLLDKINGKLWQLNWSTKSEKSEIISIQ